MSAPLPFKIPILNSATATAHDDCFMLGNTVYEGAVDSWLRHALVGDSEVAVTAMDSNWMEAILRCVAVNILRDEHDASSAFRLRPDAVLERNGAVFMKIESKASAVDLETGRQELINKFFVGSEAVFPIGTNSILGLITTSTFFELYEISFNPIVNSFSLIPLNNYNVSNFDGRRRFIVDIFKLCRWFVSITCSNRSFHLIPNRRTQTPNHHHITWCSKGLHKEYRIIPNTNNAVRLNAVLPRIAVVYAAKLEHVEWGYLIENTNNQIMITRVGRKLSDCIRDKTVTKDKAIADVRSALNELHAIGYAHCDICMDNVFVDNNNIVFLNDLEYLVGVQENPYQVTRIRNPILAASITTGLQLDVAQFAQFQIDVRLH